MKEYRVCWVVSDLDSAQFIEGIASRLAGRGVKSCYITHSRLAARHLLKNSSDVLYIDVLSPDKAYYNLAEVEKRFGTPNLRHLIFADRILRTKKDEVALDITARVLLMIDNYLKSRKIQMLIQKPMSAMTENAAYVAARANKIPAIIQDTAPIRSDTFVYADIDEQNIWTELVKKNSELKKRKLTAKEKDVVRKYLDEVYAKGRMRIFIELPKIRFDIPLKFLMRIFRRYDSIYNKFWHPIKRDGLRLFRTVLGGMMRLYEKPMAGEKFIFFPMHCADDAQIVTRCPFYYNQLELLRQIAFSVPVGYKVYTKEHPDERGVTPINLIKQMKAIKNVRVLLPTTNSHDLIKNSEAVVAISSTAGWEAFLYKKPVVNLSPIYYSVSDLVYKVKDIRELPYMLKKALENGSKIYGSDKWEKFIYSVLSTVSKGSNVEFWNGIDKVSEETYSGVAEGTWKKIREMAR